MLISAVQQSDSVIHIYSFFSVYPFITNIKNSDNVSLTVSNNTATNGGAIYVEGSGFVEIDGDVKIFDNQATNNHGGAIYLESGRLLLVNGEIYNNSSMVEGLLLACNKMLFGIFLCTTFQGSPLGCEPLAANATFSGL